MKHMGNDERNRIEFMLSCGSNVANIAKALEGQLVTVPDFFRILSMTSWRGWKNGGKPPILPEARRGIAVRPFLAAPLQSRLKDRCAQAHSGASRQERRLSPQRPENAAMYHGSARYTLHA